MNSVVVSKGLGKVYGAEQAVDGVDMEVRAGECWGLLGPNGAGKTTFLRMLIGKTPPSFGSLHVLGHAVPAEAREMRARIGMVPQQDNLDPDFTVTENLRTYAAYFGIPGAQLQTRIEELLAFALLEQKRDAYINTLSGGMQRRLSLSRALVNAPELLILDEPTTGLDPQARQLIWQRLRELRQSGITLILTTHYMEEAARLCDRVTVMDHGRFLDTGKPQALIAKYIETHVIEVHGPGLAEWHTNVGAHLGKRSEHIGETIFYYVHEIENILEALQAQHQLTYLHRPANLEDVFLKLTGRELRDG